MKQKNKEQLQNIDFPKYCKQIGILDSDELRLITNRKEYNELAAKHNDTGAHKAIDKNCLGKCEYSIRAIFVNESPYLKHGVTHRMIHGKGRMKGYYKLVPKRWNYYEQRHTLVHELVHYRFPYMNHGREFDDRIEQILKGRTFEPKHIHLFAGYDKQYIHLIDGSSNEEMEKYYKTVAKIKARREEHNAKLRQYWKVRKELEELVSNGGLDLKTQTEIKDLIDKTNNRRIPLEQTITK